MVRRGVAVLGMVLLLPAFGTASLAVAATGGVTIAPAQLDLKLVEGKSLVQRVSVTNNTSYAQELTVKTVDFGGLDESGGLLFLGKDQQNSKYGLASWMSADRNVIDIDAGQKIDVVVTIKDQSNLSPGAHYGGLLLTKEGVPSKPGAQVPLRQSLVSVFFLNKLGDTHSGLDLVKAEYDTNLLSNQKLSLAFLSTGNIFDIPRGYVQILDSKGHEVYRGALNESSLRIFPGTNRSFPISLHKEVKSIWPGTYKLMVFYRSDDQQTFKQASYSIRNFDPRLFLGLVLFAGGAVSACTYAMYRLFSKRRRKHRAS